MYNVMKRTFLLAAFLIVGAGGLFAQEKGTIEEIKDPEIDALIAKRTALYAGPREVKGYRVRLYSGDDRQAYIQMKQKYQTLYPQGSSYLKYVAPDFMLQAGDCRTYAEALKLRKKLLTDFPEAQVVEEMITVNGSEGD